MTHLACAQHLPVGPDLPTLADLLGATVSAGTVAAIVARAACGLGPFTGPERQRFASCAQSASQASPADQPGDQVVRAALRSTTTSISGSVSVICGCAAIKRVPSAAAGDAWAEPDGGGRGREAQTVTNHFSLSMKDLP